jgi:serine/threonine protein kinase
MHRDLKTENIMINIDENTKEAIPKLVDFGFVKFSGISSGGGGLNQ